MSHLIATFFYVGHMRPAPGTWGSLAALLVGFALVHISGATGLSIGIIASSLLGWWATAAETKGKKDHDPSDITKPGLVGWADRQVGPLSVMLDDIIAGLMAATVICLVMVILQ